MKKLRPSPRLGTADFRVTNDRPIRSASTQLVENDGDAFYARELVVAAAQAYVKRVRCDDRVIKSRRK